MSKPPLPSDAIEMLTHPNPCVIATLRSDGTPVATPTWYLWEDGRVLVNMDEGRRRLAHVRRDPRVTLSILDEKSWYTHVSLIGRVVDIREDTDLADIDRLSRHYSGKPYPVRDRGRVSAWVEIDRWHGWGEMKDNDQVGG
ncbi:PPOX class F420-dependent oxidoreductase [Streptomyces sp. ST2-7A]|uniref:PPOX class F420-dependent oxidoreductase n=1 Tax=Streptomyces sp. ST2-7A TaxID=2907214 RepID=UPI001F2879B6|nr:PPOX class F420-dependent oxidoreductase [Streptomyces sp. ST2-7A]MCE7081009.1 PPOX class F420-dependent oxidoreductase [Streptomyces sp. ST2-7A]